MRQVTADLQPTALDGFIATPSTEQFAPLYSRSRGSPSRVRHSLVRTT